jgi:hypothetical protein
MPVAVDEYNHRADGENPVPVEELEIEDDDDVREGATAMFSINLGDGPIDVDAGDGGVDGSKDTNGASSGPGKLFAACWEDFFPVFNENQVRTHGICKWCGKKYVARHSIGTGTLNRHMRACRKKHDQDRKVQSRLSLNGDGLHNWVYDASRAHIELCRLIARLDLPLGIGETQAFEDYIKRSHNPAFEKVSRQTTTRDMHKLFDDDRALLTNSIFRLVHLFP